MRRFPAILHLTRQHLSQFYLQSSHSHFSTSKQSYRLAMSPHQTDGAAEPHRHQCGSSTHRDEDQWKYRDPYTLHHDDDDEKKKPPVKWRGKCHCGRVQYHLRREKPLASKYCHCTTCQRLHGAPFQWAAIFHKSDISFTHGHHDLGWYDPTEQSQTHHLPCKVQCAFCRSPIMDEGRNMILLFPPLVEGINTPEGRKAFEPQCHMFYSQRVVDIRDGKTKWSGMEKDSKVMDEDGNEKQEKEKARKRHRGEGDEEDATE